MERLTHYIHPAIAVAACPVELHVEVDEQLIEHGPIKTGRQYIKGEIVDRLAEYEDTCLTPKQITAHRRGALLSDKAMHMAYNTALPRQFHGAYCWRCKCKLGVAYHESRLYSVKCDQCGTVTLVEARNPYDAQNKAGGIVPDEPGTMEG